MSCGFINNKYGLIFTKLFRGRKGWQLRRRLHGNCKKVINKAWSRDLWKYHSEGNENNLTKYYPSPYLTRGQLKKRCQLWWTACWALKLQLPAFSFVWLEAGSNIQVEENVFMQTQTMCLVWMNIKRNKINLITHTRKDDISLPEVNLVQNEVEAEECEFCLASKPPGAVWKQHIVFNENTYCTFVLKQAEEAVWYLVKTHSNPFFLIESASYA